MAECTKIVKHYIDNEYKSSNAASQELRSDSDNINLIYMNLSAAIYN